MTGITIAELPDHHLSHQVTMSSTLGIEIEMDSEL